MNDTYKKIFYLNLFTFIIIAFNLRAPLTSLGPMAEIAKEYFDINYTLVGVITSLPLITFGLLSFFIGYFSALKTMFFGIFLIIIGEFIRSYFGVNGLFIGTFLLGCGIAIGNVLVPSFIKQKFPTKISKMMGVYGFMLGISSMIGIALSLPLLKIFNIKDAMFFWVIFAIFALVVYYPQIKNKRFFRKNKMIKNKISLFKNKTIWKITLFLGTQSFLAYSLFAWLALIIKSKGFSIEYSTNLMLIAQILGLPISFFAPLLLTKIKENFRIFYIVFLCFLYVLSFFIFYVFDYYGIIFGVFLISIPWGGVFSIALFFIVYKSKNHLISSKVSSFVQGFGYLISSLSALFIGYLHDLFNGFNEVLIFLIFVSFILCIFSYLVYKSEIIK